MTIGIVSLLLAATAGAINVFFLSHGGTPISGWFIYVYFMENPKIEWMRTGGTPTFRTPSI